MTVWALSGIGAGAWVIVITMSESRVLCRPR